MKTTLQDVGPWQKAIAITLDPEEVEREMDSVVARYRQKAVIPGFRKGKVPDELVRSTYRSSLESDLLNQILPQATRAAVREHSLQLAAPPHIQDLRFRPGEPLSFTALVEVWPEIQVSGHKGLELDETIFEVGEEMVEGFLARLRENAAEYRPVFRPSAPGDIVEGTLQAVDLQGHRLPRSKREPFRMEAAGPRVLPEFSEVSVGLEAGATRIVHIQYPEDFSDPELAGKQRHYEMKVRQIQEKILPELDDAFARRVGGVDSLEALKSKIRLRLEAEERLEARQRTEESLIDRLIHLNPFDLPEGLVQQSLEAAYEKLGDQAQSEEEFRQLYRPLVERARRREILLDAIATHESIRVGEEELAEEIGRSAPAGVDPEVVRRKLEREGELDRVRSALQERKIFNFLLESATIHRIHQPRELHAKSKLILP